MGSREFVTVLGEDTQTNRFDIGEGSYGVDFLNMRGVGTWDRSRSRPMDVRTVVFDPKVFDVRITGSDGHETALDRPHPRDDKVHQVESYKSITNGSVFGIKVYKRGGSSFGTHYGGYYGSDEDEPSNFAVSSEPEPPVVQPAPTTFVQEPIANRGFIDAKMTERLPIVAMSSVFCIMAVAVFVWMIASSSSSKEPMSLEESLMM